MTYCALNVNSCQVVSYLPQDTYNLTNNFFNYTSQSSLPCSDASLHDLAIEIFRMGWILGDLIQKKTYDCIGSCIQDNSLQENPFFGGLQKAYNLASKKVDQVAHCSKSYLSTAIEKSWRSFNSFLGKEQAPQELRSQLLLDSAELGPFSDTPLVISNTKSDLPNVITPEEFKLLLKVYESIKDKDSCIEISEIGDSSDFKAQVLSDIRVILATQVGRDLIYDLHGSLPSTLIFPSSRNAYSSKFRTIFYSSRLRYHFFGSPFSGIEQVKSPAYTVLFHQTVRSFIARQMALMEKNDSKLPERTGELMNLASRCTKYRSSTWTNLEDETTINRTNMLRRELFMSGGDPGWQGRYSHTSSSEKVSMKIQRLYLQVISISDWLNENVYFWFNS